MNPQKTHPNRTKSAAQIQMEIDLMRLAYEDRMNANQYRRDIMMGWLMFAAAIGVPVIAAIAYLI